MNPKKAQIYVSLEKMTAENRAAQDALTREASLTDYVSYVRTGVQDDAEIRIWTDAFRAVLAENVCITNVRGQVGDDLVALNMYDWQDSSVDFGPTETVLCENLDLSVDSHCKAMRIEPGVYYYDDNSSVDCGLYDVIIKNVRGINTFKLYYQTPGYKIIGEEPERGGTGSGDYLFFEDIKIDLNAPIDGFREYKESDPVRGAFAGFEFGANIGHLFFENIDLTLYPEKYPLSYLFCVGPKSCVVSNGTVEVFDPYVSCGAGTIELTNIHMNGVQPDDIAPYIRAVTFDNINNDNRSTGRGTIARVVYTNKGERRYA